MEGPIDLSPSTSGNPLKEIYQAPNGELFLIRPMPDQPITEEKSTGTQQESQGQEEAMDQDFNDGPDFEKRVKKGKVQS